MFLRTKQPGMFMLLMVIQLFGVNYVYSSEGKLRNGFDWNKSQSIPLMLNNGELMLEDIPDPHWNQDACFACHTNNEGSLSNNNLRKGASGEVCHDCHDASFEHNYIHPVRVSPDVRMKENMREDFKKLLKKSEGLMTCMTCHDLKLQCLPEYSQQKLTNPQFFRGGPFKTRSEQCYFCHNAEEYQPLNPHIQLNDNGEIIVGRCRICHTGSDKQLKDATTTEDVGFHVKYKYENMCWGCHRWTPHPGGQYTFFSSDKGPDHLTEPDEKMMKRLRQQSEEHEISLPLEPGTGRVYCATCHNPHQEGVIHNKQAAEGWESNNRLRVKKICEYCHLH